MTATAMNGKQKLPNKTNMTEMFEFNPEYMARALELAAHGRQYASPNPMVGAVIVHDNKIIGEGFHRRCGEGHAEVNAVNSVSDPELLKESTMFVTLEPCSHYGKTPPCAQLIIDKKIPRVVVGATDPFIKVSGRGIKMLRDAGIKVITGVMAEESIRLNRRFFTAHTLKRPFVTLKWAMSKDGFMDHKRSEGEPAARFSTDLSTVDMHRLRSVNDAILTTSRTVNADNPSLTVRSWHGRNPQPVIVGRHNTIKPDSKILERKPIVYNGDLSINTILNDLYNSHGITSVLVETGPIMLQAFIDNDLWDIARVEVSPEVLGSSGTCPAPDINNSPHEQFEIGNNSIYLYANRS